LVKFWHQQLFLRKNLTAGSALQIGLGGGLEIASFQDSAGFQDFTICRSEFERYGQIRELLFFWCHLCTLKKKIISARWY